MDETRLPSAFIEFCGRLYGNPPGHCSSASSSSTVGCVQEVQGASSAPGCSLQTGPNVYLGPEGRDAAGRNPDLGLDLDHRSAAASPKKNNNDNDEDSDEANNNRDKDKETGGQCLKRHLDKKRKIFDEKFETLHAIHLSLLNGDGDGMGGVRRDKETRDRLLRWIWEYEVLVEEKKKNRTTRMSSDKNRGMGEDEDEDSSD